MTEEILKGLKEITPEERKILENKSDIDKTLYMSSDDNVIDAQKLLEAGKLIQARTHTRFIHFPKHTHNYIEVIYMCQGSTHHIINDEDVILNQGELLFLSQNATQEIYPAGKEDIAINFIILPEFFDYSLHMIDGEKNVLRNFVIDCLRAKNSSAAYLHFKVSDVLPVQNLIENLVWTIIHQQPNKRSMNQITMGLLFLQLMNNMDKMETDGSREQKLMISVLSYIEEHYRDGELAVLADKLHYDFYWLSKEIKKLTGKTYTELIQDKRLRQAEYLLSTTSISVMDIAAAVGYDNKSYFHRLFQKKYGVTPRKYRLMNRES